MGALGRFGDTDSLWPQLSRHPIFSSPLPYRPHPRVIRDVLVSPVLFVFLPQPVHLCPPPLPPPECRSPSVRARTGAVATPRGPGSPFFRLQFILNTTQQLERERVSKCPCDGHARPGLKPPLSEAAGKAGGCRREASVPCHAGFLGVLTTWRLAPPGGSDPRQREGRPRHFSRPGLGSIGSDVTQALSPYFLRQKQVLP